MPEKQFIKVRDDEIEAIRAWVPLGMSASQIGYLLNRSHGTIYYVAERLGLVFPNAIERKRIRRQRIKLRAANGHGNMPVSSNSQSGVAMMAPTPALTPAKVRAVYNGRRYTDDAVARRPERRVTLPTPTWMVDCGASSAATLLEG